MARGGPGTREQLISRLQRTLHTYAIRLAGVTGMVFTLLGAYLGLTNLLGTAFLGVGTSIIGSTVFAHLALSQDDLLENMRDLGVEKILESRLRYCRDDFWADLVGGAREHYRVLGVANHGFLNTESAKKCFESRFKAALARNPRFSIEILWLDPRSSLARRRQEEEKRNTRLDTLESIEWFNGMKSAAATSENGRIQLRLYEETPTCGITWRDDSVVVTHYQARALNMDAPVSMLRTTTAKWWGPHPATAAAAPLAKTYTDNYLEILAKSTLIDDNLLEVLRGERPNYDPGPPGEATLRKQREPEGPQE